ncbi:MAG TPA: hypothetical protein VHQ22_14630 [Terriglobales bacterium]|jgi:cell division protein FtsB|nr:hypothetical protein [Terriglobales bacterium]
MMPTPLETKKNLERTLELVVGLLLRAKSHFSIGKGIVEMISSEPEILNAAPTFWTLTIESHFDAALMNTFKLFDTQPNAVTIPSLLKLAENNSSVFANAQPTQIDAIVQTARAQIVGIQSTLKVINDRRNRVVAHLESTAVRNPRKLERLTKVTYSHLNMAFIFAASIINDVSVALQDISPLFDAIGISDYRAIGSLVVEAKCERIRKYETEFGPWDGPRPKNCSQQ